MTDYFALARRIVNQAALIHHGITVHDAYDCDREDCRLCADHWKDEKADKAHDDRMDHD